MLMCSMCKLRRITRRLFHKALWVSFLFNQFVIRLSLHINKINKNKIHSYIGRQMPAELVARERQISIYISSRRYNVPLFRPQGAIVFKKSIVFTFSYVKAYVSKTVSKIDLAVK